MQEEEEEEEKEEEEEEEAEEEDDLGADGFSSSFALSVKERSKASKGNNAKPSIEYLHVGLMDIFLHFLFPILVPELPLRFHLTQGSWSKIWTAMMRLLGHENGVCRESISWNVLIGPSNGLIGWKYLEINDLDWRSVYGLSQEIDLRKLSD
ncbi:hypothetical protein NC652_028090 [Populus alba x Populus x berolinensis]|nr:hypothetical protein NC652_028090 [Populus alba x Populus x berolinensis]